jgi:hypothetical protein
LIRSIIDSNKIYVFLIKTRKKIQIHDAFLTKESKEALKQQNLLLIFLSNLTKRLFLVLEKIFQKNNSVNLK